MWCLYIQYLGLYLVWSNSPSLSIPPIDLRPLLLLFPLLYLKGRRRIWRYGFLKVVSLRVHHICLPSYLSITIPGEYIELSQEGIMELDMEDLRVCPSVGLCTWLTSALSATIGIEGETARGTGYTASWSYELYRVGEGGRARMNTHYSKSSVCFNDMVITNLYR